MIDRYSRPIFRDLWSEKEKYSTWAQVERAHLEVLIERGDAPANVLDDFEHAISKKNVDDFIRREKETNHDVIAFIEELGESMGDTSAFLHKGLTSSDVVDTALVLRIKKSLDIILKSVHEICQTLKDKAFEHKDTICMGRTHGIHAEPLSFGQVLASHYAEFKRAYDELIHAEKHISYGKLSGAVGNYTQHDPEFEKLVLKKLHLNVEPVSTQIIPRDRILVVAKAVLSCGNAVERFATNLRHWGRTEVAEVFEPFGKKQKGSSAMPHKKNPILSENLCGLSRTVRGYFCMLMENAALWHERDMSHSSVERIALPDMFATVDFMLVRFLFIIQNMHVKKEKLSKQIWHTGGLWASQNILTALVNKGLSRKNAYEAVQKIALHVGSKLEQTISRTTAESCPFYIALTEDKDIQKHLNKTELLHLFSLDKYLTHVQLVFERVFTIDPTNCMSYSSTSGDLT